MRRTLSFITALAAALPLASSNMLRPVEDFPPRAIDIVARPFIPRGMKVKPPLRFIESWVLSSDAPEFGGFSALLRTGQGFIALSDAGNLVRFSVDVQRRASATVESVPKGCGVGVTKLSRDSESMTQDQRGRLWIGFEYDHRICRIDPGGATRVARPQIMNDWPNNRGTESMAQLADGRIFVIGEGRNLNSRRRIAPGIIFNGDPAKSNTRTERFGYRLRDDFRATDAARLPDGSFLVLERGRTGLLSLPGRIGILPADAIAAGKLVESRKLLWLGAPDLDQNFEAVAVSQARGRTFVWLMSDDNFLPVQRTMLLLFEYRP